MKRYMKVIIGFLAVIIAGMWVYNYFFAWCYRIRWQDYHTDKDCEYFQKQIRYATDGEYSHSDIIEKSRKYEVRESEAERCWYCW